MKGETVKSILKRSGISLKDVAEALGETPQNLQSMLRADDIKTGVLERIATAINKNLYFFYEDGQTTIGDNNNWSNVNTDAALLRALDEIGEQRKLAQTAQEQVSRLIEVIANMNSK